MSHVTCHMSRGSSQVSQFFYNFFLLSCGARGRHKKASFDMWLVAQDMWQVTCDPRHVTGDMWPKTCDRWHVTGDIRHMTYVMSWQPDSWLDSRLYMYSLGRRGLRVSNCPVSSWCGTDFPDMSASHCLATSEREWRQWAPSSLVVVLYCHF